MEGHQLITNSRTTSKNNHFADKHPKSYPRTLDAAKKKFPGLNREQHKCTTIISCQDTTQAKLRMEKRICLKQCGRRFSSFFFANRIINNVCAKPIRRISNSVAFLLILYIVLFFHQANVFGTPYWCACVVFIRKVICHGNLFLVFISFIGAE